MDYTKYKVIYFDSTEITLDNIVWGLLELNVDVIKSHVKVNLTQIVPDEIEEIKKVISGYHFAFTYPGFMILLRLLSIPMLLFMIQILYSHLIRCR